MSGGLWLAIGAAVVLAALVMLVVRARQSLAAPVDGPPMSTAVRTLLSAAQDEARARGHKQVGPEHLLFVLCGEGDGQSVSLLARESVDLGALRESAERILPPSGKPLTGGGELPYTARAQYTLRSALIEAREQRREETGPDDVVAGLLAEGRNSAARVLREAGVGRLPRRPL